MVTSWALLKNARTIRISTPTINRYQIRLLLTGDDFFFGPLYGPALFCFP